MCESPLLLSALSLLDAIMVVSAFSTANMVLQLDVDATVPIDYDILEVEGAEDGVEKESVAIGEGKEMELVIIMESGSK